MDGQIKKLQEVFSQKLQNIKNNQTELKNTLTEMKNNNNNNTRRNQHQNK